MHVDFSGNGVVSILDASSLMSRSPQDLRHVFCSGSWPSSSNSCPRSAIRTSRSWSSFFDEAHLLFDNAPKALVDKIEQVVRLIRSKGVGVYFVTQSPADVRSRSWDSWGLKIQHALRATPPRSRRPCAQWPRTLLAPNPAFDTGEAIVALGTGEALVSVLDEKGLQYYAHSNLPYRISRLFSENEEAENLVRLVDSQNRLWSLRYPGPRANRADWEAQLTSGLFFKMHDNGLQDSLLIMSPQAFAAGFDAINSILFKAIADDAVIAFPGSNRLIHLDLIGCQSKEIVLHDNARIRSMHISADLSRHIVVYTIDKSLFMQQYINNNGSFVRNNEFRMVMDRDFDKYKGVFLNFRDEVHKVKLEESWANNDNDYFFANVSVLNSVRVTHTPFFGDRNNDRNAVVKHSGWVLAVMNKDNASSTVNVTLNDMRLGTTVSYRLPLLDATNPDITYSNEHFVLFKGTGRLWYLDLRKLISVDLIDTLMPEVRGSCYLKVEQCIPRVLTVNTLNSPIYQLYTEGNDGRYVLSATLPSIYTSIGVSNGLWYFHKRSGLSRTIQALPIHKGRESSLCEVEGNFRAWLSGNGLFVANGDSLSLFEGTRKIFSSNEGVFAQSLSSWFSGHRDLLQYFMQSPAWAYSDGVLWHSRYAYYDPSSKDKEPVVVPSFSFNIKDQKMEVHRNLWSIHSLEGKVWALEVKADGQDILYFNEFGLAEQII
ncbi:MAG: DUF853 domain-containing protein [Candidatus Cloacimonetes bacterium]|nr:DUF853 domain-containing protein [Candidatus Cloacimonadota bacterium]